jgi:hypothetical protein
MTDPVPHGCTIDGQPAMPILISEYQQLTAELAALRQVARGYCPHCGRGDAAPTVADWERERQRADQAEGRLAHLQATSEAAGRLLTRTTDERDQLQDAIRQVRDVAADLSIPMQQPAEHCGHLSPVTPLTTPRTECVLHPGHAGSHADDRGCRWWPITEEPGPA